MVSRSSFSHSSLPLVYRSCSRACLGQYSTQSLKEGSSAGESSSSLSHAALRQKSESARKSTDYAIQRCFGMAVINATRGASSGLSSQVIAVPPSVTAAPRPLTATLSKVTLHRRKLISSRTSSPLLVQSLSSLLSLLIHLLLLPMPLPFALMPSLRTLQVPPLRKRCTISLSTRTPPPFA